MVYQALIKLKFLTNYGSYTDLFHTRTSYTYFHSTIVEYKSESKKTKGVNYRNIKTYGPNLEKESSKGKRRGCQKDELQSLNNLL